MTSKVQRNALGALVFIAAVGCGGGTTASGSGGAGGTGGGPGRSGGSGGPGGSSGAGGTGGGDQGGGGAGGAGGLPGGEVFWATAHKDTEEANHFGSDIVVAPDGTSLVVGHVAPTFTASALPQVLAFDADGTLSWSEIFTSGGAGTVTNVALDSAGNAIVGGNFLQSIDFGQGPIAATFSRELFVAKLSPSGSVIWAHAIVATESLFGTGVAVDLNDDVIITAGLGGTVELPGVPPAVFGTKQMVVAKLAGDQGTTLWSQSLGDAGLGSPPVQATVAPGGDLVLCGNLNGTSPLAGGLTSKGQDLFLATLDGNGVTSWANVYGDDGHQECGGVAVAADGSIVLGANAGGTIDLGGGALQPIDGDFLDYDIVLAKLDASGNHIWSAIYGDEEPQTLEAVTLDEAGDILAVGSFYGMLDFGTPMTGNPAVTMLLGGFVTKLGDDGTHRWSLATEKNQGLAGFEGVALDGDDAVLAAGTLGGLITVGAFDLEAFDGNATVVAKIAP
ncbi:MAG: hypothetical protein AAF928_00650 [Myxococcota bacterium]